MKALLYGAYGYTAQLILEYADHLPWQWVLAGRREEPLKLFAEKYQCDYQVIDLNDYEALCNALEDIQWVLHCAGPFVHTAKQMMTACIEKGVHYSDITGEFEVFEWAAALSEKARDAGVMLLPGCGFDVVPTDLVAKALAEKLPEANELWLAFSGGGGMSKGTMKSAFNKLGKAGKERIHHELKDVPIGYKHLRFSWNGKTYKGLSIPWGDVFTAWYSTGIPNITTYMLMKSGIRIIPMALRLATPFLQNKAIRTKILNNILQKAEDGPSKVELEQKRSLVWGRVAKGRTSYEGVLRGPHSYKLTALSCLAIGKHIMKGDFKTGFQTPTLAYGLSLLHDIPGLEMEIKQK